MKNILCESTEDEIASVILEFKSLGYKWCDGEEISVRDANVICDGLPDSHILIIPDDKDMTISWAVRDDNDCISAKCFLDDDSIVCRKRYTLMRNNRSEIYCFDGGDIRIFGNISWIFVPLNEVGNRFIYTNGSKAVVKTIADWRMSCGDGDIEIVPIEEAVRFSD